MEVEVLDRVGKDETEEERPRNMCSSNCTKEVIPETKEFFQILTHFNISFKPRHHNQITLVAHLRRDEPVYSPRDRRSPVVPPPPYGDLLRQINKSTSIKKPIHHACFTTNYENDHDMLTVLGIRKPENRFQKLRKNDMTIAAIW